MRLVIGVPTSHEFPIPAIFWKSYERLANRLRSGHTPVTYFELVTSEGFPVDVARNQIVRYTLGKDFTHLLFLDADHVMGPDLLERLAAHEKDVITARYHVRRPPFHPNAYVRHHTALDDGQYRVVNYGKGCFPIDRGGAGALLITRRVLEAIGEEWFRYQRNPNKGEPKDFSVSEDFWFWQRAQEEGFTCWVDWETEVQHLATIPVGMEHYAVYLEAIAAQMTPTIAERTVVCGHDGPIEVGGYTIQPYQAPEAVTA